MITRRRKHVLATIAAQAACLAVGLWMQGRFLQSSVMRQAVEAAWSELDDHLDKLLKECSTMEQITAKASAPAVEPSAVSQGASASPTFATLVDPQWRNRASTFRAPEGSPLSAGKSVNWRPAPESDTGDELRWYGTIVLADRVHLAVATALPSGDHFLVHRPQDSVLAPAAELLAFVPTLSFLTLVWTTALLGVLAYMLVARFHDQAEKDRARSLAEGLRQRQDLVRTRDAVVFGLAKLADSRDADTGDHLERISVYSTMLASILRRHPKYAREVTPAFVRLIGISSALHDIGKVGVEDRILLKPAKLTPEERGRMEAHAVIGGQCLREIEQRLGSSNFLHMARDIAFSHHERWDGQGYPHGLKGEQIPLAARIVAIADVYDALSSRRVYKQPKSHEDCVRIIAAAAGSHFDPEIVQAWLTIAPKFAHIAAKYANSASNGERATEAPILGDSAVIDAIPDQNQASAALDPKSTASASLNRDKETSAV